jgi:serine/threonine protein kinase
VHRDVKPDNLLLAGSTNLDEQHKDVPSKLKITDFNSAKRIGDTPGAGAMLTFRGTQLYYAPELLFGTGWNERVDIWCCGLCLFFVVRGELPFDCRSQRPKELLFQGLLPDFSWQGISFNIRHITMQCLAVDMRDRPPAMELLHHDWMQELRDQPVPSMASPSMRPMTLLPAAWYLPTVHLSRSAEPLRMLQEMKLSRCANHQESCLVAAPSHCDCYKKERKPSPPTCVTEN